AILRSSASRSRASPSAWARRLRSSSVSERSNMPGGLGADDGGCGDGAGCGGAAATLGEAVVRLPGDGAAGAAGGAASAWGLVGAAVRLLTFSTTTCLLRPWLKLCRTVPVSVRGFSDSVFEGTLSFFSPGVLVSAILRPRTYASVVARRRPAAAIS